jgi:magnesium-protoporphyrin IX monomethyl ester (oxidative) cyclase
VIAQRIADFAPDFVGISILFSGMADQALHLARLAKQVRPGVPVILGGNHVNGSTSDYEYALHHPSHVSEVFQRDLIKLAEAGVDYAMVGECDFAYADLIAALAAGADPSGLPGVVTFKNKHIGLPKSRPAQVDVKQLPLPARHLMDMEGYFRYGKFHSSRSTSNRVLNVMASRGCPEKCAFCSTPLLWGAKLRWREPEQVTNEIRKCIEEYRIEEVQFEDDSLTARIDHLKMLCDMIEPLGLPWCTPNGIKANYHLSSQGDLFKRMKRSGCYQVTLACESGVQRVLDDVIGKRLKVEEVIPAITNAKEAGLFVHTFWIVGFPGETRDEMERSVEMAMRAGADSYSFSILTPLPGTPIYRKVVENELWWPDRDGRRGVNYRRSQVKVDGFSGPEEFEKWVEGINDRLNKLLAERDPERARERASLVFDQQIAKSGMKQT